MVTAQDVKNLREKTGAGMMDCKKALTETNGDVDQAVEVLKEKGLLAAAKKSDRIASEGVVESYIHGGGRIGVLVEVNCETDFVAATANYKDFCRNIAMHIAALSPEYISRDEVPVEVIEREKADARQFAIDEGKPENILDKIVDGRIEKYYKEVCLMEQPYIKDTDMTIEGYQTAQISTVGENISIRRFSRFVVGEGIEKKESNLAEEVAALSQC